MVSSLLLTIGVCAASATPIFSTPKRVTTPDFDFSSWTFEALPGQIQPGGLSYYIHSLSGNDELWGLYVKNVAALSPLLPSASGNSFLTLFNLEDRSFSYPHYHTFNITQSRSDNPLWPVLYSDPQFRTEAIDFSKTCGYIVIGTSPGIPGAQFVIYGNSLEPYNLPQFENLQGIAECFIYFLHPLTLVYTEEALQVHGADKLNKYLNAAFCGITTADDQYGAGFKNGYNDGKSDGEAIGYQNGRNDAINQMTPTNIFWAWLSKGGEVLGSFLNIPIFGNVTIGAILGVVVGLTLVGFILKMLL